MKPRIHVITLAVADLDRALAFYRDHHETHAFWLRGSPLMAAVPLVE